MSGIEFDWPDAGAEQVRAAEGRLRIAGAAWARRGDEERWARIAQVLDLWTRADSPWRRGLAHALADTTPFAPTTITEGLAAAMRAWDPAAFLDCARQELGARADGRIRSLPFSWTSVIAGGAIPMPTLLQPLLSLATGSPVLMRTTSRDAVTPDWLARSLTHVDEDLAAAFESIQFPVDDAPAMEALLSAPCVVATGSDETLAAIRNRLAPGQHFVGYGHRFSVAVFGRGLLSAESDRRRALDGLARDLARWDQAGCLSPVVLYLVDYPETAALDLARELSATLGRLAESMPRGTIAPATQAQIGNEATEARMRVDGDLPWIGAAGDALIILETDHRARPAPLGRFLRIHPVASQRALMEALLPFEGQLSSIAEAGFVAGPDDADPLELFGSLGVSRVCEPGRMQTPSIDWPHDGLPLLASLVRRVEALPHLAK